MIAKYQDFLFESLILEARVKFSNNFRLLLGKVNDPIASSLLTLIDKDLDVTSNFIDIDKEKNDTVSFTPERRAQDILNDKTIYYKITSSEGGWLTHSDANAGIFKELGYKRAEEGHDVYRPNSSDIGTEAGRWVSEKSGKTYLYIKFQNGNEGVYNKDKTMVVDNRENIIWSKGRQEIKVGRIARALLSASGSKFSDRDIELFVNSYKAAMDKFNDKFSYFEIIKGSKIHYWYDEDNYYDSDGTLGNSCMASGDRRKLSLYTNNDTVEMVIYKSPDDESKILGRAILWTLMSGDKFMDRIYTIEDSDVNLFREFAKESGFYYKKGNNSGSTNDVVSPDGKETTLDLTVEVKLNMEYFPYLDTLKYYCPETGLISYRSKNTLKGLDEGEYEVYELESTEGEYSDSWYEEVEGES